MASGRPIVGRPPLVPDDARQDPEDDLKERAQLAIETSRDLIARTKAILGSSQWLLDSAKRSR